MDRRSLVSFIHKNKIYFYKYLSMFHSTNSINNKGNNTLLDIKNSQLNFFKDIPMNLFFSPLKDGNTDFISIYEPYFDKLYNRKDYIEEFYNPIHRASSYNQFKSSNQIKNSKLRQSNLVTKKFDGFFRLLDVDQSLVIPRGT